MSSFRLPIELTELVVDELARQPRVESIRGLIACCTVHPDFTDLCQREIFRVVTLYQPYRGEPDLRHRYLPLNPKHLLRTQEFVETLRRRPLFASYVRVLKYEVTCRRGEVTDAERAAISAIQQLKGLVDLTLGWTGPRADLGRPLEEITPERATLFSSVLESLDTLQTLTIRELMVPGPEFCLWITLNLNRLQLVQCMILWPSRPGPDLPSIRSKDGASHHLKHLTCDAGGSWGLVGPYIYRQRYDPQANALDFTQLESLEIHMQKTRPYPKYSHIPLLRQASRIQRVSISFHDYDYLPLWNHLNPSSFQTLTNLTLTFVHNLHVYFNFEDVIAETKARCLTKFDGEATLTNFVELTHLRIFVIIQGSLLTVSPSGCRDHDWCPLLEEGKRLGESMVKLKEMKIMVHLRRLDETPFLETEFPPDPYDRLPSYAYIPREDRFEASDGLGHWLKVAVSTGLPVDWGHPRVTYADKNF